MFLFIAVICFVGKQKVKHPYARMKFLLRIDQAMVYFVLFCAWTRKTLIILDFKQTQQISIAVNGIPSVSIVLNEATALYGYLLVNHKRKRFIPAAQPSVSSH